MGLNTADVLPRLLLQAALACAAFSSATAAGVDEWRELAPASGDTGASRTMQAPQDLIERIVAGKDAAIELPLADGGSVVLRLEPTQVMAPALASRFPRLRTYRATGAGDPGLEGRVELTPDGMRARIVAAGETTYIEPTTERGRYQVASAGVAPPSGGKPWHCAVAAPAGKARVQSSFVLPRRRLRLAIATTSAFTVRNGNTVEGTLARLAGVVNSVNAVFDDLGIEFELVANNDQIIFADAQNDPYSNENTVEELATNQQVLDSRIGSDAYDIGHLFTTDAGGLAELGTVCTGRKARAATGDLPFFSNPAFFDPFVKHEIGHQFDARHTFNGTAVNCADARDGGAAYEPGSGSTLMSYAGACGAENVTQVADDYFHTNSLGEMAGLIASLPASCGEILADPGTALVVDAGADFEIPVNTRFKLVGTAGDPGAPVTDVDARWEQYDLGSATSFGTYGTDLGSNPLFRSDALERKLRYFPDLGNGTGPEMLAEVLPQQPRTMHFRLTAARNGRLATDDMTVTVTAGSGPFAILQPVQNETWLSDRAQTVRWDVAGTDAAPIGCAAVNLVDPGPAGDGDNVLLASIPNTGEAVVTLGPNPAQRLRVDCVGNVFFALTGPFIVSADAPRDNKPPLAVDDAFTVTGGTSNNQLTPLANDTDADPGETLRIVQISANGSRGGGFTTNGTTVSYTPPSGAGSEFGTYTIEDDFGVQAQARIDITIIASPGGGSGGNSGGGGGGSPGSLLLLAVVTLVWRRVATVVRSTR